MRWIDLVPREFEKLAKDPGLCVLPMGSLERHGEHVPFGCDLVIAETIADMAAETMPYVVFPGYFLGQVHEAACFSGTVNLPKARAVEVLSDVLDGIARNGFRKIAVINCHGGNNRLLDYLAVSQLDEERSYALYIVDVDAALSKEERAEIEGLWESELLYHADESETSLYMACRPGLVRLDLAGGQTELPLGRFSHLSENGVRSALSFYADFPNHVTGSALKASEEKGRKAIRILSQAAARALKAVVDDEMAPALQAEYMRRMKDIGRI